MDKLRASDDASSRTALNELPIMNISLQFSAAESTTLSSGSATLSRQGERGNSAKVVKVVKLAPPIEISSNAESSVMFSSDESDLM
jgi:hypothetical protein